MVALGHVQVCCLNMGIVRLLQWLLVSCARRETAHIVIHWRGFSFDFCLHLASMNHGESCSFTCNDGFILSGPSTQACMFSVMSQAQQCNQLIWNEVTPYGPYLDVIIRGHFCSVYSAVHQGVLVRLKQPP